MFLVALLLFDKFSGGLISFVINSDFLKQRFSESGSMTQGNLSGGRFEMWEAAILYWLESPVIGHGMGSVVSVYSQGWNDKSQLHNYLVQYLQNFGFSGVLIILLSWLKFFATVWRKLNHESCLESRMAMSSLIVFIIVIMLIGLFSHPLAIPTVSILFWMSLGCLCSRSSPSHGFVKPSNTTLKPNYTF
jgi:O-antigen ligase